MNDRMSRAHRSREATTMVEVHRAVDLVDVARVLTQHGERAAVVAGGTDLLLDMRLGRCAPELLVDITGIDGLDGVEWTADRVRIGALARARMIEDDTDLALRAPAVVDAARVLGSVQIRNMATVGGNLCHATPSADLPPSLIVHDAEVEVVGVDGLRRVPLTALASGPGTTSLAPGEIVTAVEAKVAAGWSSCYLRQTVRWAMDLAGVGVAAAVHVDGTELRSARIALGAVAPVPLRVHAAEMVVVDAPWDDERAREAGRIAAASCTPISDVRGPEQYRRHVVAALVPRALRIAWLRATGEWPAGRPCAPHGASETAA
jgi:carbon-monoxide dehydrogenase medium subunit